MLWQAAHVPPGCPDPGRLPDHFPQWRDPGE